MKLQLLSDLHLEVHPRLEILPAPGADLLVLAGDIGSYQAGSLLAEADFGLSRFSPRKGWPTPVLFVPGCGPFADVIRALDGELANVRGSRPEHLEYEGAAASLQEVWIALRASERAILEGVTLAHVASGTLPEAVSALVANPNAWV